MDSKITRTCGKCFGCQNGNACFDFVECSQCGTKVQTFWTSCWGGAILCESCHDDD